MAIKYCFKKSKQCLKNIQLYMECLKKASKQTINLAAAEHCFIRLNAAWVWPLSHHALWITNTCVANLGG